MALKRTLVELSWDPADRWPRLEAATPAARRRRLCQEPRAHVLTQELDAPHLLPAFGDLDSIPDQH
jgi:hypothetical protein